MNKKRGYFTVFSNIFIFWPLRINTQNFVIVCIIEKEQIFLFQQLNKKFKTKQSQGHFQ